MSHPTKITKDYKLRIILDAAAIESLSKKGINGGGQGSGWYTILHPSKTGKINPPQHVKKPIYSIECTVTELNQFVMVPSFNKVDSFGEEVTDTPIEILGDDIGIVSQPYSLTTRISESLRRMVEPPEEEDDDQ